MADDYALTHKMSSKCGHPQQKRYHGSDNRENVLFIAQNLCMCSFSLCGSLCN